MSLQPAVICLPSIDNAVNTNTQGKARQVNTQGMTPHQHSTLNNLNLTMTSIPGSNNIRIAVRVWPFLPFEAGSRSCIDALPSSEAGLSLYNDANVLTRGTLLRIGGKHLIIVQSSPGSGGGHSGHAFTFNTCFSRAATQSDIYQVCVFPLLEAAMEGYNATALDYGQTSAGE